MSPMSPGVVASEHSEVTSVIRHRVKEGQQNTYEGLLREIVPIAAKFPWPSRRECHTAAGGDQRIHRCPAFRHDRQYSRLVGFRRASTAHRQGAALPSTAGTDPVGASACRCAGCRAPGLRRAWRACRDQVSPGNQDSRLRRKFHGRKVRFWISLVWATSAWRRRKSRRAAR
jgi:hypothetical protein